MRMPHGFALISAIFLLVVLGTLAFYLVSLSATQQISTMWQARGAAAHYAAQSGLEWGIARALAGEDCNGTMPIDGGGGQTFTVAVSCASAQFQELAVTHTVWTINATARTGSLGSVDHVQRLARTMIINPP